jgi:ribosomal protein S18 acetylase RimI-like enzyme
VAEWRIEIVGPESATSLEEVRDLFREYHEWLGEVVCSSRLGEEIASLPGIYAPPSGRLLLARDARGRATGVVGLRPFADGVSEMKRLYVRPEARGSGLGRTLALEAIEASRELGCTEVLLTTLPDSMAPALELYRALGFRETDPFEDHSHIGEHVPVLFMRLCLEG